MDVIAEMAAGDLARRKQAFLVMCWDLLEDEADRDHGKKYEDGKVRIASGVYASNLALEVTVLPAAHPDGLENPVVMITEDDRVIRHHGEWVHIEAHIQELHALLDDV